MRVPAWPIPIQKTKLVMSQAQPDRMIQAPRPDAGRNLVTEAEKTEHRHHRGDRECDPPPARRTFFDDSGDSLGDPAEVPLVQRQAGPAPKAWSSAEADASSSITSGTVLALSMLNQRFLG